jgi:hypothetical protein
MTKNLLRFLVMIVLSPVFVGCAPAVKYVSYTKDEPPLHARPLTSKLAKGVEPKSDSVQRKPDNLPFSAEEEWYSARGGLPQRCIALSGGGIRSASFSIGILAELSKAGVLEQTDIMSSVSGGGYALSWFYMQHYNAANGGKEALSKERRRSIQTDMFKEPPQNYYGYLLARSRFFTEVDYTWSGLANIPLVPIHLVANGLFSWRANVGVPSWLYGRKITDRFFKSPNMESSTVPTIYELGQFARKSHLPAFIFNTTAWIGNPPASDLTLHDSVFSFTPLQFGSGGYGLYRYSDDPGANGKYDDLEALKLSEVVAISGAALDFSSIVPSRAFQTLLSVFAVDLGGYIANPAVGPGPRSLHRILPVPFYFASRHTPDLTGTDIYLSDGGHSENLAVYPLVIRGCKDIIVVDAEQDSHYEFGSYFLLKQKLEDELGLRLSVEKIEEGLDFEKSKSKLAKNETPLLQYDPGEKEDPSSGTRWKKYAASPIMEGAIINPNHPEGSINIKYVKLAYLPPKEQNVNGGDFQTEYYHSWLTQECNRVSGDAVADYYYCIKQERVRKVYPLSPMTGISEPFPQQPTRDQNFSSDQFNAYVELGRKIGRQLTEKMERQRP